MELVMGIFSITFFFYILAFITIGLAQPIDAMVRLAKAKRTDGLYAIGLKRYLVAVAAHLLIWIGLVQSDMYVNFSFWVFYLQIIPWIYAIWYISHVRFWDKKLKNIEDFDRDRLINAPHSDRLLLDSYPKRKVQLKNPTAPVPRLKLKPPAVIKQLPILNHAQ